MRFSIVVVLIGGRRETLGVGNLTCLGSSHNVTHHFIPQQCCLISFPYNNYNHYHTSLDTLIPCSPLATGTHTDLLTGKSGLITCSKWAATRDKTKRGEIRLVYFILEIRGGGGGDRERQVNEGVHSR